MKRRYNKIFYICLIFCFVLTSAVPQVAEAALSNVLHKQVDEQEIRKGVTYIKDRRLTEDGWLDTHILKVDITNPYIRLDVIESRNEYNLKETTTDLVKSNGAVAGINGDFFDMSKNPTASLGMVIRDGKLISASNYVNLKENQWTTFFMDEGGMPFIDYCKVAMYFYNEDRVSFEIAGINKVTTFKKGVYLDRNAYTTTAQVDKINNTLYKIVVENDVITYISQKGETVEIPKDGYVIAIEESVAVPKINQFQIGQRVTFDLQTSIDLSKIKMALGGAGKIVDKGSVPANPGHLVSPNARNPRTALGISKDGTTVYLIAVDGRNQSLGATHGEMTSLLLGYGIYDAIHLDGGGSTTMAAKPAGKAEVTLLNKPSDGTQRKVVNGLGVFLDVPTGSLSGIRIVPKYTRVFKNTGVEMSVIGYDENLNPVNISINEIKWSTENISGKWSGNVFYPESVGTGIITAQIGDVKGRTTLTCMGTPQELKVTPEAIQLKPGESVNLKVEGLDGEGYRASIDWNKLTWKVDGVLGTVKDGKFIAGNSSGQGVLEGALGEIKVYVPVVIGEQVTAVESFESQANVEWTSYPSYVTGQVTIDSTVSYEGKKSVKMTYSFKAKPNETQAAYLQFKKPLNLKANSKAIGMWVYGDSSKDWLRGRIIDGNGSSHTINFASQIDWKGWKYVKAEIPKTAVSPISLDRIYAVTLNNTAERNNTLYIDHISTIASPEVNRNNLPSSTKIKDKYEKSLSKDSGQNTVDITVFGTTSNKNTLLDEVVQREVLAQMNNASFSIYAGSTDIKASDIKVPHMIWNSQYTVKDLNNTRIIQLSASKGGIRATNPEQWKYLQKDLQTEQPHIIIVMDKNPLSSGSFKDSMEAELFHNVLKKVREEQGKNIFVVSAEGYTTSVQVKEGVRYINLNGLWYSGQDVNLYNDFSILRFRIKDSEIYYDIQPVYPAVIVN